MVTHAYDKLLVAGIEGFTHQAQSRDIEFLIKANNLKGHGIYYYVPSLLKHFQAHQINELIVPRPHLSLNGRKWFAPSVPPSR